MNKDEMINAVQSYIRNSNAKYAILINGAWGTGKTFLYENYLSKAISEIEAGKTERKANIYISLYGISTIESLSKQLLSNYLLYAKNGNEFVKKGAKTIGGILGIASKAISFSYSAFSVDFSNMAEEIGGLIEIKDIVICFDDLERCSISVNELFGYVNNLVEHCNCKVIILADENNIGKIYANTNVEQKYLTLLTGDRKVVEIGNEEKKRKGQGEISSDVTIEELKRINELLYSENYIYKDIKEKVIGKTYTYYPDLKETIQEMLVGNENIVACVQEGDYRKYLLGKIGKIVSNFNEIKCGNLRIVLAWIDGYRKIYDVVSKYFSASNYYDIFLEEFCKYSIWSICAQRENKKIYESAYHGSQEMVYYEGNPYSHAYRYSFIDEWIKREVWEDAHLVREVRKIEERCDREKKYEKEGKQSSGKAYRELCGWRYLEDGRIKELIGDMIQELDDNKYVYRDYSNIVGILIFFIDIGLYDGDLYEIQKKMLSLIEKDTESQDENPFPQSFETEELKMKYLEVFSPVSKKRVIRNKEIDKEQIENSDIYETAKMFLEHCKKREAFYLNQRSFMEYIDIDKLIDLINRSDLEGIYLIRDALKKIYHMGNVKEFYEADTNKLESIRKKLLDPSIVKSSSITRKYAIVNLIKMLEHVLEGLGAEIPMTTY